MFVLDQYGNKVEVPASTGDSTATEGQLFAALEGTVGARTVEGDRIGTFRVISDGTVLFSSTSYFKAIDYCDSVGLIYADCTR